MGLTAVLGGTGFIGSHVCAELRRRGRTLRTISRRSLSHPDHVRADITDIASLRRALRGADSIINLVALSPLLPAGNRARYLAVHLRGARNLVQVAREQRAVRLVQVSALGVTEESAAPYAWTKARAERVVLDSGISSVVLAPGIGFGNGSELVRVLRWLQRFPVLPLPLLPTRFAPVHAADLAAVLADALTPGFAGGEPRVEIAGPQEVSGTDFSRLYLSARGVRLVPVPAAAVSSALSLASRLQLPGVPRWIGPMLSMANVPTGRSPVIATTTGYVDWASSRG